MEIRYADRAKQIMCKAIVNEDPNAKVRKYMHVHVHANCLFYMLVIIFKILLIIIVNFVADKGTEGRSQ